MNNNCPIHKQQSLWDLKRMGLKVTASRMNMLDVFKHAKKPLNAGQIARQLKPSKIDLATIYRNIESLREQKIIVEVNLKKDLAYYELPGRHHHHVVCENCGRIADISNCGIRKFGNEIIKKHGFAKINRHELEFFGLCRACAKLLKSSE